MLRHSTNLPDALRIATEREARAEGALPPRDTAPPTRHILRVRPSFVRLPRTPAAMRLTRESSTRHREL